MIFDLGLQGCILCAPFTIKVSNSRIYLNLKDGFFHIKEKLLFFLKFTFFGWAKNRCILKNMLKGYQTCTVSLSSGTVLGFEA